MTHGKLKKHRAIIALIAFLALIIFPYGCHSEGKKDIDDSAVSKSIGWLVDKLELKKQGLEHVRIREYVISDNGKYVAANISGGKNGDTSGPFYRYLIFNPHKKEIYYPDISWLKKKNELGYGFIRAAFTKDSSRCALIKGYRHLVGELVLLPEGKVLKSININDDYEEKDLDKVIKLLVGG
jgi:hypothetical protein